MEPNQMGEAGQPTVGPMPEPTPIQPITPETPVQPVEQPAQDFQSSMTMETATTTEMSTEPVQPVADQYVAPAETPKKKSMASALGMILFAIIAIGGIAFGVMMMMQKDKQATEYESQISQLKKANSELMEEASGTQALNGDKALKLLREGVTNNQLSYTIMNANVYAEYTGEEDQTAYWVKYAASTPETGIAEYNTIFKLSENGETWTFEIPGFTGYTDEFLKDYTVL